MCCAGARLSAILFCSVAAFHTAIALSARTPAGARPTPTAGASASARQTACSRLLLPDAPLDSAGRQPLGAARLRPGLVLAAAGGCCFGFFTPAFNLTVNDELGWAAAGGGRPLGVFAANGFFCLAFAASAWVVGLALMRWPPPGGAALVADRVPPQLGFAGRGRALGFALLAGHSARSATPRSSWRLARRVAADLVQAYPLVSTLWGMGLFGSSVARREGVVPAAAMYSSFVAAVALR